MIELQSVSKFFIPERRKEAMAVALRDVSLRIGKGEFVSIVGASGCGKTTLLQMIAGFEVPSEGTLSMDGAPITRPGAERAVVFQQATLYPWLTVRKNVAFGLRLRHGRRADDARVREYLRTIGLEPFADHLPHQLSGGMQQRVAIARALITDPQVLLMDEPFGALDAQTRTDMQLFLLDLWQTIRCTVVFVTHDIEEAILLSDRVVVMSARPGRVVREIPVSIARPRSVDQALSDEFIAFKREILSYIRQPAPSA